MQQFEKFCQSCTMPLENGKNSGTEKDGSLSSDYCGYCYKNGEFTDPNLTIEDMKKILDNTIGKKGIKGKLFAWIGKKQLPSLKRWKL